jgi:CBS domain-containing protein
MSLLVRDLMQWSPITVPADMPFLEVQHLFVAAHISGAPVVDGRGKVVGVVSSNDLLRAVDQACDDEVDEAALGSDEREHLEALTARDVATPVLVWASPDDPATKIAKTMREHGIHRVLVGSPTHLEGVLTTFDFLRALR